MAQYRIEAEQSELFIQARSNVHPIDIHTQGLSGTIDVSLQSGKLRLDSPPRALLQLSAELLRSGIELYDNEIHRLIEVRKYRTIRGELLQTSEISNGRYRLRGNLSLHGVTREIEGEVTLRISDEGGTLDIEGSQTIDMRDFNLDPPKILMLEVKSEVSVQARIRAVRDS